MRGPVRRVQYGGTGDVRCSASSRGLSNREIAQELVVSNATVKTHINNIFSKAELRDRTQAVVYAVKHGLAGDI